MSDVISLYAGALLLAVCLLYFSWIYDKPFEAYVRMWFLWCIFSQAESAEISKLCLYQL
jgi:hypothetical protein